ncbi:MAG: alpha/beta fold hydrolase [Candidatus Omnitrophica bacterium]|nr:alpha/beta fold hydrolase [Candidatus Omnitrophota bacterium]
MKLFMLLVRSAVWVGVGCFLFTFVLLVRNTFLPRYPYEVSLKEIGLTGEEVRFRSRDGLWLSGTLLLAGWNDPWIILCHGVGANRFDLIEMARFLVQEGSFNIFFFDFRAHGKSEGWATSFGYREQRDLLGALDYLESRRGGPQRYGLYGISMGASVGILVAAEDLRIQALCVDSPFVDLEESIAKHSQLLYPLPRFPFAFLACFSYNLRFLTDVRKISPIKVVHKISPRPLFIMNGGEDDRMLPERARDLYEKASEPKTLWLIPGAGHLEGRAVAEKRYDESVLHFFSSALR